MKKEAMNKGICNCKHVDTCLTAPQHCLISDQYTDKSYVAPHPAARLEQDPMQAVLSAALLD